MTDELKKALESAVTDEQKKAVVEKFKEEISKLSEEELDKVAGGKIDWDKVIKSIPENCEPPVTIINRG